MSLFDRLQNNKSEKLDAEKEAGAAFMKANAAKEGVQQFENGIQYEVLTEGHGPKPAPSAKIKAHYAGRLLNGTEFDSSFKRNEPFTAPLNALIQGWQYAIPHMKEGSKWLIWIPSDLAYGDAGAGGSIPGGATLEFEIELLQILSK